MKGEGDRQMIAFGDLSNPPKMWTPVSGDLFIKVCSFHPLLQRLIPKSSSHQSEQQQQQQQQQKLSCL